LTEDQDRASSRKTALLVGTVLGAMAAWNVHRGRISVAVTLGGLAGLLMIVGLFLASWARRFHHLWMGAASVLGSVQSRILLAVVYYGVVTPLGVVMKMTGRDDLGRRGSRRASYWIRRATPRQTKAGFEKSF
jgi:hypothetical protein